MKKKLRRAKLTLNRETLATLDSGKMADVQGGLTPACTLTCHVVSICLACTP